MRYNSRKTIFVCEFGYLGVGGVVVGLVCLVFGCQVCSPGGCSILGVVVGVREVPLHGGVYPGYRDVFL